MSVSASGEEAGCRHDASWCPRLCMNRFRCNCRVMPPTLGQCLRSTRASSSHDETSHRLVAWARRLQRGTSHRTSLRLPASNRERRLNGVKRSFENSRQRPDGHTVDPPAKFGARTKLWSFHPVPSSRKSCCNRSERSEVFRVGSRVLGDAMRRRDFIKVMAGMTAAWPIAAHAQTYPSRPITMVRPLAAGGAVDVMGRILASRMSEILGQQVIIENVTGAAGIIGVNRVVNAAPDGYTFLFGSIGTHAYNQTIY